MKKTLIILIFSLLVIAPTLYFGQKVVAISWALPDTEDYRRVSGNPEGYGGNAKLVLSIYGPRDNTLESARAYVKLYFNQPTGNFVEIHGASFCGYSGNVAENVFGNRVDGTTRSNSWFLAYNAKGSDGPGDVNPQDDDDLDPDGLNAIDHAESYEYCDGNYLRLNLGTLEASTFPGHEGKYIAYVEGMIERDPTQDYSIRDANGNVIATAGAVNAFNVFAGNGGIAGQYSMNAKTFEEADPDVVSGGILTYQDRGVVAPGFTANNTRGDYTLKFAPNCNIPAGSHNGWLKWGNLEQGTPLQNPYASFTLYTRHRDTNQLIFPPFTYTPPANSNAFLIQRHHFWVNRDYKYEWVWNGVQRNNALQLWMPFDSAEYGFDCGDPPPEEDEIWKLENETAGFGTNYSSECSVVGPGNEISFGSTIQNVTDNAAVISTGNFVDIRIHDSTPSTVSGTTLERVSGDFIHGDVEIGASQTYSMPEKVYRVPQNAEPGDIYTVYATYVQALDGLPGYPINIDEQELKGVYAGALISGGPRRANACVRVADFAFMKVNGSGVHNGGVWKSFQECQNASAQMVGEINKPIQGMSLNGIGSSAQYGVTSLKTDITGFGSGIGFQATIPDDPKGLSFANTSATPGKFLGDADSPATCLADLYELLKDENPIDENFTTTMLEASADGAGTDVVPRLARHNTGNFLTYTEPFAGKAVVLAEGSVEIYDNIEYSTDYGSYSDPSIPSFVLIVKGGDIKIHPQVTRLDGLYIAIPNDDGGFGEIVTCYGFDGVVPGGNEACGQNQLTINGALISRSVDFHRYRFGYKHASDQIDIGTIGHENSASEIINFRPEMFIANPFSGLVNSGSQANQKFQYYAERAPVY